MRLLELRGNEGDADAKRAALLHKTDRKPAIAARTIKRPATGKEPAVDTRVFPINTRPPETPLRRQPFDLEQLQRRIEELERRIHERARSSAESAQGGKELEQLRQRIKLLERRIEGELWSARQREYTLLEMLARPPIQTVVKEYCTRLLRSAPLTTLRWLKAAGKAWWQDAQPLWWPRFVALWQEALARARS
jgi:hypothetical protein